jgi:hypothetical protein
VDAVFSTRRLRGFEAREGTTLFTQQQAIEEKMKTEEIQKGQEVGVEIDNDEEEEEWFDAEE